MQIGTSNLRGKDMTWLIAGESGGHRSRSQETEVRFGGMVKAWIYSHWVEKIKVYNHRGKCCPWKAGMGVHLIVTSFWNYDLTQELYDSKVTW